MGVDSATQLSSYYGQTAAAPPQLSLVQPLRVLLVDDEAIVRTVITSMLRRMGSDVLLAGDGREALALYAGRAHEIDLVIFDLMLPDMTGEDLYEQLRRINPAARAMLITGYSESHLLPELQESGLCGVLPKPFDIHDLRRELNRLAA